MFIAAILTVDLFGDHNGDDGARGVTPPAATTPSVATSPSGRTPASSSPAPANQASTAAVTPADHSSAAAVTPADHSSAAAATRADAGAPQVVYEVTASGSGNIGSIAYTDQDGDIIRRHGVPLPWRTTFPVGSQRHPLVLDAQRKGGSDTGPVTCTITVAGKVLATTTAEGRYGAPLCSGSA
ncbi:MmpS family transport accessory protein [Actinoplanes philippinensis]|uniref:MmpS family transport accessory protein n=1 Tax=Actinoplanes philippinensis TaxID=35752 RepID=UPI0033E7C12A